MEAHLSALLTMLLVPVLNAVLVEALVRDLRRFVSSHALLWSGEEGGGHGPTSQQVDLLHLLVDAAVDL